MLIVRPVGTTSASGSGSALVIGLPRARRAGMLSWVGASVPPLRTARLRLEPVTATLAHCGTHAPPDIARVGACTAAGNMASRRVLGKAGYRLASHGHDECVYEHL